MAISPHASIEDSVRTTQTNLSYLLPGEKFNRRFVAPGVEVNSAVYRPYPTTIRDGRSIKEYFKFDQHGFQLLNAPTVIADFHDKENVEAQYKDEVCSYVKKALDADFTAATNWMLRTSGSIQRAKETDGPYRHHGGIQPPASEVHVDTEPSRQLAGAQAAYDKARPDGPGFKRFIVASFWRTFSPPPQICTLAVCDAGSVRDDEGVPSVLWIVDKIPDKEAMLADMDDDNQLAAAVFHHSPDHRWWYFSDMTRDEGLLFKFHDSDHSVGWRVPHVAFWDDSFPDANVRESIECRTISFFE